MADIPLRHDLPLLGRQDIRDAARELGPILAHATAGDSDANREAYGRNPGSLRRPTPD
jgi:hypothetical protein